MNGNIGVGSVPGATGRSYTNGLCSFSPTPPTAPRPVTCAKGTFAVLSYTYSPLASMPVTFGFSPTAQVSGTLVATPTSRPIATPPTKGWGTMFTAPTPFVNLENTIQTATAMGTAAWWSGSTTTGAVDALNCGDFLSTAGSGRTGIRNVLTSAWVSNANTLCTTALPLLCACVN